MSERLTKAEFRMLETWAYSTRGTCDRLHTATTLWSAEPEHLFLSGGYNGAPAGQPACDEAGHLMVDGHCIRTNHGEENALLNCHDPDRLEDGIATILGSTPCYPCARKLVSKKIGIVEYIGNYENAHGAGYLDDLFKNALVKCVYISTDDLLKTLKKAFDFSGNSGGIFKDIVLPAAFFGPRHANIKLMGGGKLIIFEGIDGCGKSTQIKMLEKYLVQKGYQVFTTKEPGGGLPDLRERIFALKEDGEENLAERELELFEEDRRVHYHDKVLQALASGKIVLQDRGGESTKAYQGYGRGMSLEKIEKANYEATYGRRADLTIFLDMNVDDALNRLQKDGSRKINRFEKKEFLEKVKAGYLEEAFKHARTGDWQTVWADDSEEIIFEKIKEAIEERMGL